MLANGELTIQKVLSTPNDLSQAVLTAAAGSGAPMHSVEQFAHGTTVTTNAVIQRRGAPTGLLTTRGFRDVLQIRRTTRGALYDFQWDPPPELVPREWRREVPERTNSAGVVTREADLDAATTEARSLVDAGVRSLAVCFLNAYLNDHNERVVRAAVGEAFPDLPIYISSSVLPEWREFERTSTTVVSAYVGPVLTDYVGRLVSALRDSGYGYDLLIMLASGGLATATAAMDRPAYTIGSGPAAGVLAQMALGKSSDAEPALPEGGVVATMDNLIGMDIGGTSTDISLVHNGNLYLRSDFELEFGTPVSYPVIEINSIGAGGGTIAWVDRGGMLHVGPQSAGADPGPACMQLGGTEPTVTDANVVLHRLNPEYLLGGEIAISEKAAHISVSTVGERLGLGVLEMANGILTLAASNIVLAIRQQTIERGLDPREFVLVAYGGAGPLHATGVAEELGVMTVLVPPKPGVTSALGLLLTDIRHDFVATYLQEMAAATPAEVGAAFDRLVYQARARLEAEGVPADRVTADYSIDLRYVGQTHELTLKLPAAYSEELAGRIPMMFGELHEMVYGHAPEEDEPIEIVNLRVGGIGRLDRPLLPEAAKGKGAEPRARRSVFFGGRWVETPVYHRDDLRRGDRIVGPAIVEQLDSTTVISPGWMAEHDRVGSLILKRH